MSARGIDPVHIVDGEVVTGDGQQPQEHQEKTANGRPQAPGLSREATVQDLHAAASDLRFVAGGGVCDPRTLRAHADVLLAIAEELGETEGNRA